MTQVSSVPKKLLELHELMESCEQRGAATEVLDMLRLQSQISALLLGMIAEIRLELSLRDDEQT